VKCKGKTLSVGSAMTDTLRRMIREDCSEAVMLGFLSKSDVVDIVRREVSAWEFEIASKEGS
jgi:hypothetical protein